MAAINNQNMYIGVLWHSLLIHRQFINSPVISTDHGMLISTDHVMLISTAWLNMTILWTTEGRPRSGRPWFVHCIVMFSQAVEINMTWSVDINMPWSVYITGILIHLWISTDRVMLISADRVTLISTDRWLMRTQNYPKHPLGGREAAPKGCFW